MNVPDTHPLLLTNLKAQTDSAPYLQATSQVMGGYGTNGPKPRPWAVDKGVQRFSRWCYMASMANATAFAQVPLRLYVRRKSNNFKTAKVGRSRKDYLLGYGRDKPSVAVLSKVADFGSDFEEMTEPHPAMKVLRSANGMMDGFVLQQLKLLYLQMTGNYYQLHTVYESGPMKGIPFELWPMPSQHVKINVTDGRVTGYKYGREPGKDFPAEDVIQWRLPNLLDPVYYGMSPLQAAWSAVGLSEAKRDEDTAVKDNRSMPDWILAIEGAGPDALRQVEAQAEQKLRGTRNRGKLLATSGRVTAQALNMPVGDLGDPDRIVEEIFGCFRVPITMAFANDPNRANADTAYTGWMRGTIAPYCQQDEEQLNGSYLTLFDVGEDAVLAYDNPVPTDEAKDADVRVKYVQGTVYTPNEVRELEGLPPVEGGDELLVASGMVPLSQALTAMGPFAGLLGGFRPSAPADGAAPTETPATDAPPAGEAAPGQDIQTTADTVLNGAQVTAATALVAQVTAGELPRDSGVAMLQAFFNLTPEKAEQVMGSAGKPGVPTTPNPNPAAQAAQDASQAADAGTTNDNPADATGSEGKGIQDGCSHSLRVQPRDQVPASGLHDTGDTLAHGARKRTTATASEQTSGAKQDAAVGIGAGAVEHAHVGGVHRTALKSASAGTTPDHTPFLAPLRKVFAAQAAEVLATLSHKTVGDVTTKAEGDLPHVLTPLPASFDLTTWDKRLAEAVQPIIESIAKAAAKAQAAALVEAGAPVDIFSVVDKALPATTEKLALKFAESTNATTSMQLNDALSKLRTEIRDGITSGDTVAEMKGRVQTVFDQASDSRAETIARTEASRARHTAEQVTVQESGVVKKKVWLRSEDACPICDAIADEYPDGVAVDANFGSTDYGPIDGPPAHPNCTCSLTYELDESKLRQPATETT